MSEVIKIYNNVVENRLKELDEYFDLAESEIERRMIYNRMDELHYLADQMNLRLQSLQELYESEERGF